MITSVTLHFVARLKSVREDAQNQKWYFGFVFEGGSFDLPLSYKTSEGQYLADPSCKGRLFSFDTDCEPASMPVTVGDRHFNVTVYRPVKDALPLGLQLVNE